MWILEGVLDGKYFTVTWLTQDRAIADRERRLRPVKGKYPMGWTAVKRDRRHA